LKISRAAPLSILPFGGVREKTKERLSM